MTMKWPTPFFSIVFSLCVLCVSAVNSSVFAADKIEYNRDVRPILAEHCFACHGPDSASRKADLRLDKREAAVESQTIVPGNPDESELVLRVFATDRDEIMPPPKAKKPLSA